jgi:predicted transcriptional regulator
MADGEITLKLDNDTAAKLAAVAKQAGAEPEDWASQALAHALDDEHWAEARRRLEEFDAGDGATLSVDEYFAEFRRKLAAAGIK